MSFSVQNQAHLLPPKNLKEFKIFVLQDQRMSRGRFRGRGGRGKARGGGCGFPRGGKTRNFHEDGNTQNHPPKVVRGRGPRRYEAVARNSREVVGSQRKQ